MHIQQSFWRRQRNRGKSRSRPVSCLSQRRRRRLRAAAGGAATSPPKLAGSQSEAAQAGQWLLARDATRAHAVGRRGNSRKKRLGMPFKPSIPQTFSRGDAQGTDNNDCGEILGALLTLFENWQPGQPTAGQSQRPRPLLPSCAVCRQEAATPSTQGKTHTHAQASATRARLCSRV